MRHRGRTCRDRRGPFLDLVHIFASQYGWTVGEVMELTPGEADYLLSQIRASLPKR